MGVDANDALLSKATIEFEDFSSEDEETALANSPELDRDADAEDNYFKTKEPPPEGPSDDGSLGEIDAGTIDFTAIPPRVCLQFLSSLISPGGIGKSALRIVQGWRWQPDGT